MDGYLYGGQTSEMIINEISRLRLEGTTKLSGEAEKIHEQVRKRMCDVLGENFGKIKREAYVFPSTKRYLGLEGFGGVTTKDGNSVILIEEEVTKMSGAPDEYKLFRNSNTRKVTPADWLANVLSHEYGHIIFGEYLRRFTYDTEARYLDFRRSTAQDEAFAFWFGDTVSDSRNALQILAKSYEEVCNPEEILRGYDLLERTALTKGNLETIWYAKDILGQI